jgi:hypothetical protein
MGLWAEPQGRMGWDDENITRHITTAHSKPVFVFYGIQYGLLPVANRTVSLIF